MPIRNFQFPGVELTQVYGAAAATITSEQYVLCVGPIAKPKSVELAATGWNPTTGMAASDVSVDSGYALRTTTLNSNKTAIGGKLTVTKGIYVYAVGASADITSVNNTDKTITFDFAVAFGNGESADVKFGTRGIRIGDPIAISKDGVADPIIGTVSAISASTGC